MKKIPVMEEQKFLIEPKLLDENDLFHYLIENISFLQILKLYKKLKKIVEEQKYEDNI